MKGFDCSSSLPSTDRSENSGAATADQRYGAANANKSDLRPMARFELKSCVDTLPVLLCVLALCAQQPAEAVEMLKQK